MGWSIGHDRRWGKHGRDIGYGVPANCDHPGCDRKIDRGLAYVCGSDVLGGEHGCGLFFCGEHRRYVDRGDDCPELCERCAVEAAPFDPTPDTREWIEWKLSDESWGPWRAENPEIVAALRDGVGRAPRPTGSEAQRSTGSAPNPSTQERGE